MKWHAGISQLHSAHYPLVFREVIEYFLSRLLSSVLFQMLCHNTMREIDNVRDDDVSTFLCITNEVLDIDLLYHHPSSSTRPSVQNPITRHASQPTVHQHHLPPQTNPSVTNSSATPVLSNSNASSLVCSNCRIRGHTAATCFKPGGGLEGQRDQYLANRNRAKAFLAQIEEVLDGTIIPLSSEDTILDTVETIVTPPDPLVDTCNPLPLFSALSMSVVNTPTFNDDLFDIYPSFDFHSPGVLSAFELSLPSLKNRPK